MAERALEPALGVVQVARVAEVAELVASPFEQRDRARRHAAGFGDLGELERGLRLRGPAPEPAEGEGSLRAQWFRGALSALRSPERADGEVDGRVQERG